MQYLENLLIVVSIFLPIVLAGEYIGIRVSGVNPWQRR